MNIAEFQVIRSPRQISVVDPRFLFLEPSSNKGLSGPVTNDKSFGTSQRVTYEKEIPYSDTDPSKEETNYNEWQSGNPVNDLLNIDIDFVRFMKMLSQVDQWLLSKEDRVSGKMLVTYLTDTVVKQFDYDSKEALLENIRANKQRLTDTLIEAVGNYSKLLSSITIYSRFILIAELLNLGSQKLAELNAIELWAKLYMLDLVIPFQYFPQPLLMPFVPLVREAYIADLAVVRKEWACYLPGEIANIRNIMAGESFSNIMRNIREIENVQQTVSEERTQSKTESEQDTNTELSNEINDQLNMSLNGYLDVKSEFKYPIGTTNISAGVNGDISYERSTRHASQIAQRAVSRASSSVDKLTRESRQRRELQRTEDTTKYRLKNGTDIHHRGIYRWVDRIDRYQTFLYPDRLQLEFQLPEPANYYRARMALKQSQGNTGAPPEFKVQLNEITPANALNLATTYHASNLPSPPEEHFSLLVSKTFLQQTDTSANGNKSVPTLGGEVEVIVPDDYSAVKVTLTGAATAAYGTWDMKSGVDKKGFMAVRYIGIVGGTLHLNEANGSSDQTTNQNDSNNTIYLTENNGSSYQIYLSPSVKGTLKFGVLAYGATNAVISFNVECTRTPEAMLTWQYSVYDALFAGWKQWQEEWEAGQVSQSFLPNISTTEGSSQRNLMTVRDELKRQVISWMLQESPFEGRPGLLPNARTTSPSGTSPTASWNDIDLAKTRTDAPVIQFLEQAFDWGLMSYIFYPYYWADDQHWDELSAIQANDPDFERFLKAGSARVIAPVRKNMEKAVYYYLITGRPFLNQPLPIPGHPMYLSIAREIQDLTQPPENGIPGNSWEVLSTTTLLVLDDKEELPRNSNMRLTAPKDSYCEDEEASIDPKH